MYKKDTKSITGEGAGQNTGTDLVLPNIFWEALFTICLTVEEWNNLFHSAYLTAVPSLLSTWLTRPWPTGTHVLE